MKATPSSAFIVAMVCSAALSSYALAGGGGHGHHHGHGMQPPMMPDNPMMMGHGMPAAQRDFFANESKSPVRNRATSPAAANAITGSKEGATNSGATQLGSNTVQQAVWAQNATKRPVSAMFGNPPARAPIPIPIKTVPANLIVTPAGEPAPLNAPSATQMFKGASSAGSTGGG